MYQQHETLSQRMKKPDQEILKNCMILILYNSKSYKID
jgi:hypothetical protein